MKPINLPQVETNPNFNAVDPLDSRYYDSEISKYLSERSRLTYQAYVESALGYTLAEFGVCSQTIAEQIEQAVSKVTAEAVAEEEKTTKHDVKALVNVIKSDLSDEAKPYVHFGATSYDIVATALSLQLRDATLQVMLPRLISLEKVLLGLSDKYAETVQVGRTHGQHAVPITFGFAMAEYVDRLGHNIVALRNAALGLRGKFSGAVGAYNALSLFVEDPLKFEKNLLSHLNIEPASYSTQIVPAEYYVRLVDELAISAGIMANLGHDMRHLQRTEIAEVREAFETGQTGSSTMAHKRNPWNFENVISMSKQVNAQLINANLNIPSEHQRDLTDSASARFYGVVIACVASMAKRLINVMSKLEVDEENMKRNLLMSSGAIAAEPLYLLLEKYGHTTGHEVSKELSHKALENGQSLYEVVSADPSIADYFSKFTENEKNILMKPEEYYSGLSTRKARDVNAIWNQYLASL
jgi:adenylosuccinate lyase